MDTYKKLKLLFFAIMAVGGIVALIFFILMYANMSGYSRDDGVLRASWEKEIGKTKLEKILTIEENYRNKAQDIKSERAALVSVLNTSVFKKASKKREQNLVKYFQLEKKYYNLSSSCFKEVRTIISKTNFQKYKNSFSRYSRYSAGCPLKRFY